ncbi:S8 family peptidase [uncultured Nostoc sp.]|uniref:S8 family peptidase n=1 Tax=uncultured Nostoc sp. TaxID=340711 RepID=UPI0026129CEE|nr:S8 family peptidase [uncultured Nostoc sp.]
MRKLDPRLRYLLSKTTDFLPESNVTLESTAEKSSFLEFVEPIKSPREIPKVSEIKQPPYMVAVLVSCNRNFELESLRKAGMNVYSIIKGFYTVVSGEVLTSDLHKLDELEFVMQVEAPRPMMLEELDISLVETGANAIHDFDLPVKGKGIIVAIIDFGIDYTHPSFRHQDGTSRILYLWDQDAPLEHQQDPTEEMEEGLFTRDGTVKYGREYTREQIDQVLRNDQNSSAVVSHIDSSGHGTHVAGIAAGNGFVADENGIFSQDNYVGIAPEADLIVVALKRTEQPNNQPEKRITLGNSANVLQALDYIVQRANGCPVAINISLGTNAGGHSGETLLETAIDNLARQCNVVIVKSAGNEQTNCIHAGGTITQTEEVILELEVPSSTTRTYLELWYENSTDQNISIALRSPSGETINFVNSENSDGWIERTLAGRNIRIDSDKNTGDTVITIRIDTYIPSGNIQPGNWQLLLQGNQITEGRYDIWIDNSDNAIKFTKSCADASRTITIPGTAKQIITVGSYLIRHRNDDLSQPIGSISSFSCSGTTRYGLQKPEIAAPGEWIISARSKKCKASRDPDGWHTTLCGTSMAAPHVTGASALILSVCPGLTCEQVKQILMKTALSDEFTSEVPNHSWGSGKLNVQAAVKFAYQCAENFLFPRISNVQINGATLSWETDMPTKAIVRFHTQQDKLRLGKFFGQQGQMC